MIRNERPFESECRALFVFFTTALLVATHWPGLDIRGPIDRTDLIIHCCVFFIWTCLLYGAGFIASCQRCSCGKRRLIWTAVVGICFAVFDESTQPFFSRVFDPFDLVADCTGVLLAVSAIALTQKHLRWGGTLRSV